MSEDPRILSLHEARDVARDLHLHSKAAEEIAALILHRSPSVREGEQLQFGAPQFLEGDGQKIRGVLDALRRNCRVNVLRALTESRLGVLFANSLAAAGVRDTSLVQTCKDAYIQGLTTKMERGGCAPFLVSAIRTLVSQWNLSGNRWAVPALYNRPVVMEVSSLLSECSEEEIQRLSVFDIPPLAIAQCRCLYRGERTDTIDPRAFASDESIGMDGGERPDEAVVLPHPQLRKACESEVGARQPLTPWQALASVYRKKGLPEPLITSVGILVSENPDCIQLEPGLIRCAFPTTYSPQTLERAHAQMQSLPDESWADALSSHVSDMFLEILLSLYHGGYQRFQRSEAGEATQKHSPFLFARGAVHPSCEASELSLRKALSRVASILYGYEHAASQPVKGLLQEVAQKTGSFTQESDPKKAFQEMEEYARSKDGAFAYVQDIQRSLERVASRLLTALESHPFQPFPQESQGGNQSGVLTDTERQGVETFIQYLTSMSIIMSSEMRRCVPSVSEGLQRYVFDVVDSSIIESSFVAFLQRRFPILFRELLEAPSSQFDRKLPQITKFIDTRGKLGNALLSLIKELADSTVALQSDEDPAVSSRARMTLWHLASLSRALHALLQLMRLSDATQVTLRSSAPTSVQPVQLFPLPRAQLSLFTHSNGEKPTLMRYSPGPFGSALWFQTEASMHVEGTFQHNDAQLSIGPSNCIPVTRMVHQMPRLMALMAYIRRQRDILQHRVKDMSLDQHLGAIVDADAELLTITGIDFATGIEEEGAYVRLPAPDSALIGALGLTAVDAHTDDSFFQYYRKLSGADMTSLWEIPLDAIEDEQEVAADAPSQASPEAIVASFFARNKPVWPISEALEILTQARITILPDKGKHWEVQGPTGSIYTLPTAPLKAKKIFGSTIKEAVKKAGNLAALAAWIQSDDCPHRKPKAPNGSSAAEGA